MLTWLELYTLDSGKMRFQQDGATSHIANHTVHLLVNRLFPETGQSIILL